MLPLPRVDEGQRQNEQVLARKIATISARNRRYYSQPYQHACLCFVSGKRMTNTSMRERFGIEEQNAAKASRIIADTLAAGQIRPFDPEQGKKYACYLPFWA